MTVRPAIEHSTAGRIRERRRGCDAGTGLDPGDVVDTVADTPVLDAPVVGSGVSDTACKDV